MMNEDLDVFSVRAIHYNSNLISEVHVPSKFLRWAKSPKLQTSWQLHTAAFNSQTNLKQPNQTPINALYNYQAASYP